MTQQTKKLAKNSPCHCGSGRKYKRCCLPKELAAQSQNQPKGIKPPLKLKNTFRKEIHAKDVSDVELMYRDQCVLLVEMESHKARLDADADHFRAAIASKEAELVAIKNLPASEGKQPSIEACEGHIKSLKDKLEGCKLPRVMEVQMDAVEKVVALGVQEKVYIPPKPTITPEAAVAAAGVVGSEPVNQKPPGERITQSKPMKNDGEIKTSGGGVDDDDDDDDESLADPEPEDVAKPQETEPAIVQP